VSSALEGRGELLEVNVSSTVSGRRAAHTAIVLRFRRPPRSFVVFLLAVIGIGAALGHVVNAAGLATFFFFIAAIDPKPAWNYQFGKPGTHDDGRAYGRFNSWQRVSATSPEELRRLPNIRD